MNAGLQILFRFLLTELDIGDGQLSTRRLVFKEELGIAEIISETAAQYGLRATEVALTLDGALSVSGRYLPIVTALDDDSWLVLQGFRQGRIQCALIKKNCLEQHLLKTAELVDLLGLTETASRQWFLLEIIEPLAGAKSHDEAGHLSPFKRFLSLLNTERNDLILVLIFSLATGLLYLATPVAVQSLVNTVALGGMIQPLVVLGLILFIFLAFAGLIYVLQTYLVELVQRRIFVTVSADLSYRLPRVKCSVYDRCNGAELVNRFFDVMTLQKSGATLLLEGISTVLQALIGLLVLAAYHPLLLVFDLILVGLIAFIVFFLGRKSVSTAIEESKAKYQLIAWLETIARNMTTFKFDGGPALARQRADELTHLYLTNRKRHYRVVLKQTIGAVTLHAVAGTGLLVIGGLLVVEGQLTLGQLVAAELIVSGVLASFAKFGKQLESFYDLMAGVDKVGHLIDLPLERDSGEKMDKAVPLELKVMDLSFRYHSQQQPVKDLSFQLQAKHDLAIVCPSGGGKTTLADLLSGLRFPDSGRIEIGGIDIRELKLEALRQEVAIAGRHEVIEDSLIENIRLGRSDISNEQIRDILEQLALLPSFLQLPERLYTEINVSGAPLSESELNRLLIARAIVARPGLLIIDGLLDNLDEPVRQAVFQALLKPERSWSLLVLTRFRSVAGQCSQMIELAVE